MEELHAALDTAASQLLEREATIGRLNARIDNLGAELDATNATIDRLLSDIKSQQREMAALQASKSWRWTALVRAIHGRLIRHRPT